MLAECTVESVKSTAERSRDTAEIFVSGVRKSHYRRGFNSVRGGSRAAFTASGYKSRNTLSSAPGGRGSIPIGQRVVKGVVAAVTVCVATEIKKKKIVKTNKKEGGKPEVLSLYVRTLTLTLIFGFFRGFFWVFLGGFFFGFGFGSSTIMVIPHAD